MSELFQALQAALADRYLLERELGRGGMATVYLGRELKHPRHVAIKVLRPELAGVMTWGRFLREIRISAELTHPHILPLLDSGTVPPTAHSPALPYYTMPYVDGESLRDRLKREQQLPLDDALEITRDIGAALGYAHAHGVIHRDIKPENILLMGGHAVVADFGIARAVKEAVDPDAVTSAGLVIGTPAYMSPEQAGGRTELDGRSDLYSLGCVLYEMLGGEPPFTGASPQAVLARHRMDHAPSLRTLRASVPAPVEQAVMRVLEKSPADRFGTAEEFVAALQGGATALLARSPGRRAAMRPALLGAALMVAALVVWRVVAPGRPRLEANKVVVFPLVERGAGIRAGTGQEIALMIGSALEHTDPLKWIDGWTWMNPRERADIGALQTADARRIAHDRSARYYLDGAVISAPDSDRVILRLNDVLGDSVVAQATAAGVPDTSNFPQLGLRAVNMLLPQLLEPGRRIDLKALADRQPAAIALWLQGEREYRSSHFASALDYQRRAVEVDSALAYAALKGALAAEWEHHYGEAAALVALALRNDSILPPKYVRFAEGLRNYYADNADSAAHYFRAALQLDPDWSEGWAALGEVHFHLYADSDSAAQVAFSRARIVDPEFAPPLFHLAEIALGKGDTATAAALITQFQRTDPDSLWLLQLTLTLDCLRGGPAGTGWSKTAAHHPLEVVQAAKVLASRGAHPACAESGFRAVLAQGNAPDSARWGAVLGLQGILSATGRVALVQPLLDSAITAGLLEAYGLYIVHAVAGNGMDARAASVIATLGTNYRGMGAARLWYLGIWLAHTGARRELAAVASAARRLADSSGTPLEQSTARSLEGRLALLDGDTSRAIPLLQGVVLPGSGVGLDWKLQEPFGQEQLLLAELLLKRGHAEESLRVADGLDNPRILIYLLYLRRSLELRIEAARRLGRPDLAAEYEQRLADLS